MALGSVLFSSDAIGYILFDKINATGEYLNHSRYPFEPNLRHCHGVIFEPGY